MNRSKESKFKKLAIRIRDYRIRLVPGQSWRGVLHTLFGSAIIGLIGALKKDIQNPIVLEFSFMIMYLAGAIIMFLYVLLPTFFSGNLKQGLKSLWIVENTDAKMHQTVTYLSVKERYKYIYIRGALATGAYFALNVAGIYFKPIDNAQIFGADALFFILLSIFWLKEKFKLGAKIATMLASGGVVFILFKDLLSFDPSAAFISAGAALFSAVAFCIIIVMTSIIIRHDTPLRVTFHQCVAGVGLTIVALLVTLLVSVFIKNDFSYPHISEDSLKDSIIYGSLYAIAVYHYFRAFLFTRPVIIAALYYSMPIFTIIFELFLGGANFNSVNFVPNLLIMFGCGWLMWEDHKEDKKKSREKKVEESEPIYQISGMDESAAANYSLTPNNCRDGLNRVFLSIKERFNSGSIDIYKYISERHEFNKILLEYSKELGKSNIESIEILPDAVIFSFAPLHIKLETDGAARSAPFEVLNFGSYEPEDALIAYSLIQDGDTIIDMGANIGWYAVNFAKRFPHSLIYAFEPIPATYTILIRNIKRNEIQNSIAFNCGISNSNDEKLFYYFKGGSAIASIENLIDHKKVTRVKCKMTTLDQFAIELGIRSIDFVKCDVEGCELFALQGAKKVLQDFKPIIFVEIFEEWCKKCGYQSFDVINFLNQYGYCFFEAINGRLNRVENIRIKDEGRYNYFFLHSQKHAELILKFS